MKSSTLWHFGRHFSSWTYWELLQMLTTANNTDWLSLIWIFENYSESKTDIPFDNYFELAGLCIRYKIGFRHASAKMIPGCDKISRLSHIVCSASNLYSYFELAKGDKKGNKKTFFSYARQLATWGIFLSSLTWITLWSAQWFILILTFWASL